MGTELAASIVFDIEDELTDCEGFNAWWYNIQESERQKIRGFLAGVVDENIEKADSP
jgi:hypothetical protein